MNPLPSRKPSAAALEAMEAFASHISKEKSQERVEQCEEAFSSVTGHSHVELVGSGGEALRLVLSAVKGGLLIPDQGIWKGIFGICSELGISVHTMETDLGLIDTETLTHTIETSRPRAVLITSFAGYIAEQDTKAISRACRESNTLLIEDASSAIGDEVLAKGRHADVIVGSARRPKLLNLDSGGFVTTDNKDIAERIEKHNKTFTPDPVICAGMEVEIKRASETLASLSSFSKSLKDSLDNVIHRDKRGPCAGVLLDNPKKTARKAVQTGLVTEAGKTIFTTCPRIDRFLEQGLVIEVKKLDVEALGSAGIDTISSFIKGFS